MAEPEITREEAERIANDRPDFDRPTRALARTVVALYDRQAMAERWEQQRVDGYAAQIVALRSCVDRLRNGWEAATVGGGEMMWVVNWPDGSPYPGAVPEPMSEAEQAVMADG